MGLTQGRLGTPWSRNGEQFTELNRIAGSKLLQTEYLKNAIVKELYEWTTTGEDFAYFCELLAILMYSQVLIGLPSLGMVSVRELDKKHYEAFAVAKKANRKALTTGVFLLRKLMKKDYWDSNEEFSKYANELFDLYEKDLTIFTNLVVNHTLDK
jgi:hypothetical protein